MVSLKETTVRLQVLNGGRWTTCEEFEALKSVKDNFNSASKLSTCVECMPGRFRFLITLSTRFVWGPGVNALSIELTFDEGDPIDHYRIVVLKPEAQDLCDLLGLRAMTNSHDGPSFCVETIAVPLGAEDTSLPWFETGFEFERYSQGERADSSVKSRC